MPIPDHVFSHLDRYAETHHYGSLATTAALVQDYIHHCHDEPGLPAALATIFQNLKPAEHVTQYQEAFTVNLRQLTKRDARLLIYYTLTGRLPTPPGKEANDQRDTENAGDAIAIALALLQNHEPSHAYTAKLILSGVRRRLKVN